MISKSVRQKRLRNTGHINPNSGSGGHKNMIILHQMHHPQIPKHLDSRVFGSECVRDNEGRVYHGESVWLSGKPERLRDFARTLGSFWTTNNPMIGDWQLFEFQ